MRLVPRSLFRLVFIAGFFLSLPFCGQAAEPLWRRWGTEDGLASLQTRQVICLPGGQIVAVVEGMVELFDGERFLPLPTDRTLTASVHSFLGASHFVDARGRLWVRTLHDLMTFDTATLQQLDTRSLLRQAGTTGAVQNFFVDADGRPWVHTGTDSLMRLDDNGKACMVLRITERNTDGIASSVNAIVQVGKRHYVFFSSGRMACVDARAGHTLYSLQMGDADRGYYLTAAPLGDGRIAVRRASGGRQQLVAFDTRQRCVTDTLLHQHVAVFAQSPGRELWATDNGQVWHFNRKAEVKETFRVPGADLIYLCVDGHDGLWGCTFNKGLFYHAAGTQRMVLHQEPSGGAVKALCVRPDGILLVGTGQGLYTWKEREETEREEEWNAVAWAQGMDVLHIDTMATGRLLLSTRNCGAGLFNPSGARLWHVDASTDPKMRNQVDFCLPLPAGDGFLMNTRMNRLIVAREDTPELDHLTERLEGVVVSFRRIVQALPFEDGWVVATQNGIFFLQRTSKQGTTNFKVDRKRFAALADNPWSIKFNCLLADGKGGIWAGTQNGLLHDDGHSGKLHHYGTADGLPTACVQSMVMAEDGTLYAATTGGICRINEKRGEVLTLDADDGLPDLSFIERVATRLPNGRILFGTTKGFYSLWPDSMLLPRSFWQPMLLFVKVAGSDGIIAGQKELHLTHRQNFLTFTVTTQNYAHPTHTRFRYKLEGIDQQWVVCNEHRNKLELSYTALPPGRYTLQVQAALQGQPWGPTLTVPVVIAPPLWLTWWAKCLYILLLAGIVTTAIRTYRRQRRMYLRIKALQRERALIFEAKKAEQQPPSPLKGNVQEPSALNQEPSTLSQEPEPLTAEQRHFLAKAMACVDRNMANSDYNIDTFASDMAMERSTLYRKLQTVMGQSPLEFVRTIRLKHAAELLRSGRYSVIEVSERVGFNTPRYFTKYFKDMYGVPPSQYR